jgi:cell division protein ZapB
LDQETVLQQFEILETKVERLIEALQRRDSDNAQLQEKEAAEKRNDALKALVRDRIDSLMGRLSEFTEE